MLCAVNNASTEMWVRRLYLRIHDATFFCDFDYPAEVTGTEVTGNAPSIFFPQRVVESEL